MSSCERGMGWHRDLADTRDYRPDHPAVHKLLQAAGRGEARSRRPPSSIDLREFLPPPDDQGSLNASTAFAVLALVAYFEARAHGRPLDAARLFLYQMTLKLLRVTGNASADLRTAFKALVRFGAPPEIYWPYRAERFPFNPTDAFLFSFGKEYESIHYVRLDEPSGAAATLRVVKAFLAAGFPSAFGFSVPSSLTMEGDVAFRPRFDAVRGGLAALAVGYDDHRRIASDRGALLFRSAWGPHWGERGYGWLPYAYVLNQFAVDFWTALRDNWIDSGVFVTPLGLGNS
jgi:C1A family cysteine protease